MNILKNFVFLFAFAFLGAVKASAIIKTESILADQNTQALKIYNQLKLQFSKRTDPLIIVWGDRFTLYYQQNVHHFYLQSQKFDELKEVSHIVLAVNPGNE